MTAAEISSARFIDRDARIEDLYAKCTFGAGVLMLVVEVLYFGAWQHPTFWLPSWDATDATIGRDFLNTWMGGRSTFAGGPAAWFDVDTYNAVIRQMLPPNPLNGYRYFWSYPPDIVLFIWPFGLLPYLAAYISWCAFGLITFVTVSLTTGIERRSLFFLAVAPGVAVTIFFGQNGFVTAALLVGGLAALDRRPILAGILFGILTIKPQLGILLPVMLVLTGRWRTIAAAAATTATLVAITAALYGADIWMEYFRKVGAQQNWLLYHSTGSLIPTVFYGFQELGFSHATAWTAQIVASAFALGAVIWTFYRRRDEGLSWALLVTAIFLFSPYSYNYDMVVLAWVAALLRQRTDNMLIDHYLILAVWMLPVAMMLIGTIAHVPVAVIVLPIFAARLLWRLAHAPETMPSAMNREGSLLLAQS